MNILSKGALTVGVVTVIAAGMIIFTGNNGVTDNANDVDVVKASENKLADSAGAAKGVVSGVAVKHKSYLKDEDAVLPMAETLQAPPPGPYLSYKSLIATPSGSMMAGKQQGSYATKNAVNPSKVTMLALGQSEKNRPSMPTMPTAPKAPSNLMQAAPVRSNNLKDTPIWMQNFTESRKVKIQPQATVKVGQKQNVGWMNFPQQYMYVPAPMLPNNFYVPQPVFNVGFPKQNIGFKMQNNQLVAPQPMATKLDGTVTPKKKDLTK
ncbi:MAG: hypothetical protein V3U64_04620 [Cocleimonas sp.]